MVKVGSMLDFGHDVVVKRAAISEMQRGRRRPTGKLIFDILFTTALLLPLFAIGLVLIVVNPFLNSGPLMFRQERMGLNCEPFIAWKFRTMTGFAQTKRGAFDKVEAERITWLGHVLRRSRIDELPQIINVLRGEMSLIGPRPDCFAHARVYLRQVPDYAKRHSILPGISGYAQTEVGYVEGYAALRRKVAADLYYLDHRNMAFDLWITWRTLCVVAQRRGC